MRAGRVALGVMARAPSDRRGKTRLIAALGLDNGLELRRAILLDTLDACRQVPDVDCTVLFTPDAAKEEIASLAGDVAHLIPQRGTTLGERIEHAFADLFARGYDAAALIGSDLPSVPPAYLNEGIAAVMRDGDPIVLGPAEDGGYYFVGLRQPHPALFRGIPWSTEGVLGATLAAAGREGLTVRLIPSWYDLDAIADLDRAVVGEEIGRFVPEAAIRVVAIGGLQTLDRVGVLDERLAPFQRRDPRGERFELRRVLDARAIAGAHEQRECNDRHRDRQPYRHDRILQSS